tara:strand:+ start:158 stop:409 length:252 start_codon:yes stop_codon:yes gene_type:complete
MEHSTTDTNTCTNKETEMENIERLKQMTHIYHHFTLERGCAQHIYTSTARESLVEVATGPDAGLVIEDADEREQFIRDLAKQR